MTENKKPKKSVDPYTGEKTVEAQNSGKVTEIMPVNSGDREGKNFFY